MRSVPSAFSWRNATGVRFRSLPAGRQVAGAMLLSSRLLISAASSMMRSFIRSARICGATTVSPAAKIPGRNSASQRSSPPRRPAIHRVTVAFRPNARPTNPQDYAAMRASERSPMSLRPSDSSPPATHHQSDRGVGKQRRRPGAALRIQNLRSAIYFTPFFERRVPRVDP